MTLNKKFFQNSFFLVSALMLAAAIAGRFSPRAFSVPMLERVAVGDFSSEGWIRGRTEFQLPHFLGGLHRLEMRLAAPRSTAGDLSKIAVSVCGRPEEEFVIGADSLIRVRLPWRCVSPRLTMQPVATPGEAGQSLMQPNLVKLVVVRVASRVGGPVIALESLLTVFAAIVSLAVLATLAGGQIRIPAMVAGGAMLVVSWLVVFFVNSDPNKLAPLAIVCVAALGGCVLYDSRESSRWLVSPASKGLVWLALLVGASLRLYGIRFGLPSNFHPDEVPKVNAIMRMVEQHSLNPQYFLHPSLLLYCSYAVNTILHSVGIEGSFRETAFFAGRLVSACAGIASIALTYQIGKRLFSREVGGIAACLLAVFPLHVTCSRYLKEDALLTFFVLSCFLTTIIAVQSQRRWLLLFAGLLAGCTAGAKYSGILMAIVPGSAPWIASRSWKPDLRWVPWSIAAMAIAPLGFLATTPYALLNSQKFLKDFGSESRHMQTGHTVSISAWSQLWMYHFWRSMWPGMTGLVAVVACFAFGFLLRRARFEDLLLIGVTLLFYLPAEYVKAKPAPQPERYILPCLPFLAIGIAEFLRSIASRGVVVRAGALLATAVLFFFPLNRSVLLASEVTNDTRDRLALWMKQNLPPGSKVLMDWKPYCPNFHGHHFKVEHIPRAYIIKSLEPGALKNSGADYLVLSSLFYNRYFSQPEAQANLRQRFRDVFKKVPVITQFEAPSGTYGFHNPTLTLFSLKAEDFARLEEQRKQKMRGELEYTSNEVRARAKW